MRKANDPLATDIPPNMFVTRFYAILDPKSGTLSYLKSTKYQYSLRLDLPLKTAYFLMASRYQLNPRPPQLRELLPVCKRAS